MSKIINSAFTTKIYPNEEQEIYFNKCFGVARFTYNWFLDKKKNNYSGKWKDFKNVFMNERILIPWIFEVNSRVYRIAIDHLMKAYDRYYNKISNEPKFKSKKNKHQSFCYDRCMIKSNNIFYLACGNLPGRKMRSGYNIKTSENISFLKSENIIITKITIYRKGNNEYFVSFQYKEKNYNYENNSNKTVGIDLGLKTFATQSDGKTAQFPKRKIIKIENKIRVLQRVLNKKQRGSNNYKKVRTKLNNYYQKITNIKLDFLHKYTTWLCKNYKNIKIEDLDILKMLNNKNWLHQLLELGGDILKV